MTNTLSKIGGRGSTSIWIMSLNILYFFLTSPLSEVFTSKDKAVIETSRTVTDWISLAIQLKSKSVSVLFLLEKVRFVESCLKVDRNLREYMNLYLYLGNLVLKPST